MLWFYVSLNQWFKPLQNLHNSVTNKWCRIICNIQNKDKTVFILWFLSHYSISGNNAVDYLSSKIMNLYQRGNKQHKQSIINVIEGKKRNSLYKNLRVTTCYNVRTVVGLFPMIIWHDSLAQHLKSIWTSQHLKPNILPNSHCVLSVQVVYRPVSYTHLS